MDEYLLFFKEHLAEIARELARRYPDAEANTLLDLQLQGELTVPEELQIIAAKTYLAIHETTTEGADQ